MTKTKILTISVISLVVLNIVLITVILIGPPRPHMGPKSVIVERLDFSKEQVKAFDQLIEAHSASVKALSESIKPKKEELYLTILSNDKEKEKNVLKEISKIKEEIELLHLEHFRDIEKLCNSDQKGKFNGLIKDLNDMFLPHRKRL